MSFGRILAYRWHDHMSNDMMPRGVGGYVNSPMVRERQLCICGHVPRLPAEDPAHQIVICLDPNGSTIPRAQPQASYLRQLASDLEDVAMASEASSRAMVRRIHKHFRGKVDDATHCSGV